jgi:glycosyltransferase involved in cell wall biosynthesis
VNPLSVLHVDSAGEYRGGQNQARLLMKELRAFGGIRQGLVARSDSRLISEAGELGVDLHPVAWISPTDPRPVLQILAALNRDYDLIHAHDSHGLQSALAARWLGRRRTPIVASRRVSVRMRSPSVWRRADAVVAVSQAVAAILRDQDIPAEKIRVIPDGVSPEELEHRLPGRLREKAGARSDQTLVGTVGALTAEKGHEWFLRSVALIAADHTEARFVLFGDGPERDRLVRLADSLGLTERVAFPGSVSEIGRSIGDLDLFVMPSLEEGLGTAALEALVGGCPVLLSGAGGLVDLAGGLIPTIPPGDVAALAAELDRLLSDSAARRLLAGRCRERGGEFTSARTARATLALYRELAES